MFVSSIIADKGSEVVTAAPACTVAELVARLAERRIGAVVICDPEGDIAGIVSERDIVAALAAHGTNALARRAADLMSLAVATCSPDDPLERVMQVMTERRIRHLPVTEGGRMAGLISIGDVVKHLIAESRHEAEALRQYIATG